jgi:predicted Zn-ribbon and HTH transcriptional regulator
MTTTKKITDAIEIVTARGIENEKAMAKMLYEAIDIMVGMKGTMMLFSGVGNKGGIPLAKSNPNSVIEISKESLEEIEKVWEKYLAFEKEHPDYSKIINQLKEKFILEDGGRINKPKTLANVFGYSNEEIDKIRKKDREEILSKYGDEYVVFDFKNNTMFSPKDSEFYTTTAFPVVVSYKREVDAWGQKINIDKWLVKIGKKNDELSVITLNDANEILYSIKNVSLTHQSLGTAKELGITPTIKEHDMIAECGDCGEKFSYLKSKKDIQWECPECKSMKRIS